MKRLSGCMIASALVLVAGVALAKPPVPISECGTVITEPGKYRVTQDLFCARDQQGIEVLASDVTVNLNGHTITCDASGEILVGAVLVGDFFDPTYVVSNVRVKNGTVSGCDDGVIFFYSQSGKATKITATGNVARGITVLEAKDTLIKNNVGFENNNAIESFGGMGTKIKGNLLYDNFGVAIGITGETDSVIACNQAERNDFGIQVGPFSSGNVVRGNYVSNAATGGITLYGFGIPEQIFEPVPFGNLIKNNVVQGSGVVDLSEIVFNPFVGFPFVPPDAECQNTWRSNQYVTLLGPVDCIAPPVELDDDDVCALDDDDDDDD